MRPASMKYLTAAPRSLPAKMVGSLSCSQMVPSGACASSCSCRRALHAFEQAAARCTCTILAHVDHFGLAARSKSCPWIASSSAPSAILSAIAEESAAADFGPPRTAARSAICLPSSSRSAFGGLLPCEDSRSTRARSPCKFASEDHFLIVSMRSRAPTAQASSLAAVSVGMILRANTSASVCGTVLSSASWLICRARPLGGGLYW
mmetsp:Transcript_33271/g.87542  ORF Transcript_33271/g.87542 Transcript_33271/m.87542 type:complete len:206 (+) Transcript_33271:480-1097(+)